VQYTNPAAYPPLEHSSRILADDGWKVLFLGTQSFSANELVFPPHQNVVVRLLRYQPSGWRQKLQYLWFIVWSVGVCLYRKPQVVYISETLSTPVGLAVWLFMRIPVLYHEHDTPGPPPNCFLRFVSSTRLRLARTANLCVIPNEERRLKFEAALRPRSSVCVWNCPSRTEVIPAVERSEKPFTLWFHGSLNPVQFPLTVIAALAQLPDFVRVRFAGYETVGHIGYVREVFERAKQLGVGHRVEYAGTPGTRKDLYALASTADVGMSLFARSFREPMAGASNKPFDYLACGLALLVTDTSEWTELYVENGYGKSADPSSVESIAQAVRAWVAERGVAQAMGEAGRQRVLAEWNYEKQFKPVKRLLEEL
jgi:glycosyltransferase involved in cell wall biosynthesis